MSISKERKVLIIVSEFKNVSQPWKKQCKTLNYCIGIPKILATSKK